MIEIDITSDIDQALIGVEQFASRIEGTAAWALDQTAFDIRRQIVDETWPTSVTVRNRSLARWMFQVLKKARKGDLVVFVGQRQDDFRDWVENQATGGVKTGRGGDIAIPVDPGSVRAPTGRVKAALKPRRITDRKNTFLIESGGQKKKIVKRVRGSDQLETVYIFRKSAQIPKRFNFYEDSERVAVERFPVHMMTKLNQLIARSVFSGSP